MVPVGRESVMYTIVAVSPTTWHFSYLICKGRENKYVELMPKFLQIPAEDPTIYLVIATLTDNLFWGKYAPEQVYLKFYIDGKELPVCSCQNILQTLNYWTGRGDCGILKNAVDMWFH